MVKKTIIVGCAIALLSALFFGRDAASYVATACGRVEDTVKDSIPLDFEIDRARKMVANLLPDIRRSMHVIAKEEVEVQQLEKQIATAEGKLTKSRQDIMRLKNDVASYQDHYQYNGRRYTIKQVKLDLANRFHRYKTNEATMDSLHDIHQARVRSLEAARQKLDGMLVAKRQLEVDVENLEARLKMIEVAQTASEINVDDRRLGRAKELISGLRTRLEVAERIVNSEGLYQGEIDLDESETENIVDQVTEYFNNDELEGEVLAADYSR